MAGIASCNPRPALFVPVGIPGAGKSDELALSGRCLRQKPVHLGRAARPWKLCDPNHLGPTAWKATN